MFVRTHENRVINLALFQEIRTIELPEEEHLVNRFRLTAFLDMNSKGILLGEYETVEYANDGLELMFREFAFRKLVVMTHGPKRAKDEADGDPAS